MHTLVREFASDARHAAMPAAETHIVVRRGPMARDGLDLHVLGPLEHVRRKHILAGMRVAMTRLPLGAVAAVLGISARALAGRVVALEELWGAPARELRDRIAATTDLRAASALVERAVAERLPRAPRPTLALAAAPRLATTRVREVADELGVSERQLRRVFHDAIGVSPKAYARLHRFQRALDAARGGGTWTRIAAATGYCDQAHLIDDFRAIAGATPRAFLRELSPSRSRPSS